VKQQRSGNRTKARPKLQEFPLDQLHRVLADHRAWMDSDGQIGKKADLSSPQLQGISLWRADLREADLSCANLQGADLDHARLRGARLRHANMVATSLWQANLRDADLSHADLRSAKLDHADLSGANLNNANLTGISLWGARGFRVSALSGRSESATRNSKTRMLPDLWKPDCLRAVGADTPGLPHSTAIRSAAPGEQDHASVGMDWVASSPFADAKKESSGNGSPAT
jgi:uncharacterized protein YjbI with pentapeptide repeats